MNYTEEAPGVFSLQLYTVAECQETTAFLRRVRGWGSTRLREEVSPGRFRTVTRTHARSALTLPPLAAPRVRQRFEGRLRRAVLPLIRDVWGLELGQGAEVQILKYLPGGRYLPHSDVGMGMEYRYFSVVCYLNDVLSGGQTSFPSLGFSASPHSGRALIFPSSYIHCAEPVGEGEKYALVAWIHGPVPVRWI